MRYENDYSVNYGDSVEFITRLYDVQTDESKNDVYNEDERKMLQVLDFLAKETDASKLVDFAKLLMQEKGIRSPVFLQGAIQKVKSEQTQILNNSLSNISRLKELYDREKENENPLIKQGSISTYVLIAQDDLNTLGFRTGGLDRNIWK